MGSSTIRTGGPRQLHSPFHRRYRNFTGSAKHGRCRPASFADFTAGQEFHLAPKTICCYYYRGTGGECQEEEIIILLLFLFGFRLLKNNTSFSLLRLPSTETPTIYAPRKSGRSPPCSARGRSFASQTFRTRTKTARLRSLVPLVPQAGRLWNRRLLLAEVPANCFLLHLQLFNRPLVSLRSTSLGTTAAQSYPVPNLVEGVTSYLAPLFTAPPF